ncbi:IS6 family transposase [Natranaerobius thermophilus]|uniref:Integrase catalytic region n=1 Tax=Natranaerobius thermophilus (strain ATCC BAA-1301 / DSM 18059 / JW/NM-WN-LF) TaxID=457570 RepID=B2A0U4_NATTJ|nr:IS6 family transposase [Natranaerobius thermophilus]ACB83636.1 Integrase catalytic region [Natranaerobius thermophilus JW/NM-WN-LF]ACB83842.1 Integrase catalytic region [Natranaerobius thermophilus JW/NM-WN-LF]ACB84649.1 Integrase catalytic region [Natranaerobius thermophilus JW/NM-WN-LF]ACB85483.1 Integrase catalytic region [Natranaerobius thermophilus JW/NM-WN-LF]ACB85745.1 Integrase catalytic region [Natranaerobius thermophilus JW/NM-WN-LF]
MTKVVCPRCNNNCSDKFYRFGFDNHGHQKYQCQECFSQFAPKTLSKGGDKRGPNKPRKYPSCPKCGKATFLHHDYEFYSNLRCWDKSCNHSFYVPKPQSIPEPSQLDIDGKVDFSNMRHSLHTVIRALYLYFINGSSTRGVSQFLIDCEGIKVSHVTIADWTKKFAPLFLYISRYLKPIDLDSSDEWHVDETVIKIKGKRFYAWTVIDAETRFVLAFHLSPYRDSQAAFKVLNYAKKHFGQPHSIVTDRYWAYNAPIKVLFPNSNHIRVESFQDDISNNLIESFFQIFKSWVKQRRGFASFQSANKLIAVFVFAFNFVRTSNVLNQSTPAQVAGINYSNRNRTFWLLHSNNAA